MRWVVQKVGSQKRYHFDDKDKAIRFVRSEQISRLSNATDKAVQNAWSKAFGRGNPVPSNVDRLVEGGYVDNKLAFFVFALTGEDWRICDDTDLPNPHGSCNEEASPLCGQDRSGW